LLMKTKLQKKRPYMFAQLHLSHRLHIFQHITSSPHRNAFSISKRLEIYGSTVSRTNTGNLGY
jgi:hypothetical protein